MESKVVVKSTILILVLFIIGSCGPRRGILHKSGSNGSLSYIYPKFGYKIVLFPQRPKNEIFTGFDPVRFSLEQWMGDYRDWILSLYKEEYEIILNDMVALDEYDIESIVVEFDKWAKWEIAGEREFPSPRIINLQYLSKEIFSEQELSDIEYVQSRFVLMEKDYLAVRSGYVYSYIKGSYVHHYSIYNKAGVYICTAFVMGLPEIVVPQKAVASFERSMWDSVKSAITYWETHDK